MLSLVQECSLYLQPYDVNQHVCLPLHLNLDLLEEEIKEESDGFSVYIDPKTVDQIEKKKEILERALNLLSQID